MKKSDNKKEKEILEMFSKHIGKSQAQLIKEFKLPINEKETKNIRNLLVNTILNKEKNNFIDDKIKIKTISINELGTPLESMSFAQIKYKEIVNEDWENSYLYKTLTSKFLFVIFKLKDKKDKNPVLANVKFWKMNSDDLDIAYKFWELTKDNIIRGDYKNFITIKNNFICHVRSKGINSKDLMETPQGTREPKKGYWINSSYIKTQIN
jgi:DNA mismatch repair protein MutH